MDAEVTVPSLENPELSAVLFVELGKVVTAFSSLARIWGVYDHSFPACAFFSFFFKWR